MGRLSAQTTITAITADDLLYIVDDSGAIPTSHKTTIADFFGATTPTPIDMFFADNVGPVIGTGGDTEIVFNATDMIVEFDKQNTGTTDFRIQQNGADRVAVLDNGAVVVGSAAGAGANQSFVINRDFTSPGIGLASQLSVRGVITAGVGDTISYFIVQPGGVIEAASGTHDVIASFVVNEPDITDNGATTTIASSIFVQGAPTEGVSNFALYINSGATFLNDSLHVVGTCAIGGGASPLPDRTLVMSRDFTGSGSGLVTQLLCGGTMTGAVGDDMFFNVVLPDGIVEAASGTHNLVASLGLVAPSITDNGATTALAATLYILNAPSGGTDNYALHVDSGPTRLDGSLRVGTATALTGDGDLQISGNFDIEGYGAIGDGSVVSADNTLIIDRNFTIGAGNAGSALNVNGDIVGAANTNFQRMILQGSVTIPAGTTARYSVMDFAEPNITATGTLTTSTVIYIADAATEGTNNYAIFVDGGDCRFDGDVILNGGVLDSNISVDSTAVADQVSFGGYEIGAGNRVIALSQETVVAVEVDETKFSHKMQVRINGSTYFMMLTAT